MTPFDPVVVLTTLLAFYPIVSAAALATARRERPEMFAGGVLFGTKGDKLRLPDGREYDLIVAAGGPASGRRWQVSLIVVDPNAPDDPFALEDGPLVPLDEDQTIGPRDPSTLESLVAGELAALGASDEQLRQAGDAAVTFDGAADLEDSYRDLVEPAETAHGDTTRALDGDPITEVLETSDSHARVIDATLPDYDEPEAPDIAEPHVEDPPPGSRGSEPPPEA